MESRDREESTFMRKSSRRFRGAVASASMVTAAITVAALSMHAANSAHPVPMTIRGVVAGSYFTPPAGSTPSSTVASYYQGAVVCADVNDNARCDVGEASTTTDIDGSFFLHSLYTGPLVAEVATTASNGGHAVAGRVVFRAVVDQIAEGAVNAGHPAVATPLNADVVITPLSTEVARMMDDDSIPYETAKGHLATRLTVPAAHVLADPNVLSGAEQTALLRESVILTNRFTFAAKMVDRGDLSSMKASEQAAMNLEQIPRYDHIFAIILENKNVASIKGSPLAPAINAYLNAGNQFTNYYATGNPSEPNYTAIASADDFGITDDSAWNCMPSGDLADVPDDAPPSGLATPCVNATNHNIKGRANLFTALSANGMSWRIYNESQNPGRDWRLNSAADATILAHDHVYGAASPVGAIGNPNLMLTFPSGAYATKHNNTMAFQNVRSDPDFVANNRTMGGGQWDAAFMASPSTPAGWDTDQLGTDLASGDVGNLNFLVPDQCDDMHGIGVTGPIGGGPATGTASDCGGNANIYRGDLYVDALIKKIEASPIWTNPQKRVAIVIMFDEGTATTGLNSCCGWNPVGKPGYAAAPGPPGVLVQDDHGNATVDTSVVNYNKGNKGHGTSVFGVLTNQPLAPKGVVDSDAYSHISFVRTLQDMYQLADPANDWSYMNRSKYTESFIANNPPLLPEYVGSPNAHFDAVRPMNHHYVNPVTPDPNQRNGWALK
jgi:hypothetical protein